MVTTVSTRQEAAAILGSRPDGHQIHLSNHIKGGQQLPQSSSNRSRLNSEPHLEVLVDDTLTRNHILQLAAGTAGAIRITNALPTDQCRSFTDALDTSSLSHYDSQRYRLPAARLGPVLNEFNEAGNINPNYWRETRVATKYWRDQASDKDLRSKSADIIASAWGSSVVPASVDGRELFWGIIREINSGTLIHWDEMIREYPVNFLDRFPIAQLAFNLFISTPPQGGHTTIWRKRWRPADEHYRTAFGYEPSVVANAAELNVTPQTGDAIIFDSRNFHAVRDSAGGRRVSISFFIGVVGDGSLILWS